MSVTRTELLEADPLPPLKPMKPRVIWGFVGVVLMSLLGLLGGRPTFSFGFFGLALWIVYVGYLAIQSRSFMQADGTVLRVRNLWKMREVNAADVVGVRYQFNGRRPDFQLELRDGKRVWIPTSKFVRGHSTLFAWVGWFVPDAEIDAKSKIYRDHLLSTGAI
ncbi:hypothetical protein [Aestuariimicrobium ganziense]|uniref:hypothetical protein n=1 Tax=Aestuariimicrobium ganziense TaxID=2773677 RepID=UPI0019423A56|nr:hypothetical protein [Aestuariimicrobium ganziense]